VGGCQIQKDTIKHIKLNGYLKIVKSNKMKKTKKLKMA